MFLLLHVAVCAHKLCVYIFVRVLLHFKCVHAVNNLDFAASCSKEIIAS